MRSKRDIKMGRLCTPGGAVLGVVGGGVTFRFLNGEAILDENMLFWGFCVNFPRDLKCQSLSSLTVEIAFKRRKQAIKYQCWCGVSSLTVVISLTLKS